MKNRKKEILIIAIVIIIQTIIYTICGINKSYIHMDEAYSLGLASYDKVEIQDNEDFYNNWHEKEYYEDYLSVQQEEVGKYSQVYENQKNDVHPPLYYLLLRIAMGFSIGHYSKWSGIIINIIIYAFITIFMYLILQKLLKKDKNAKEKSIIVAFISSIVMASLTNVIYIRMYSLSTLNILITTFLHMKLMESEKISPKLLVLIGISALAGSLTHYYYLFYLFALYILFAVKYIKEKKYKELVYYTLTMVIAGGLSILIFPYSIKHMFFGYRGQGAISKLTDMSQFLTNIGGYLEKINVFAFNKMLILIIIACIFSQDGKRVEKNEFVKMIMLPTIFYFVIVAIASPWIELRYIAPVCGLIFILVIHYFYKLLQIKYSEKITNIVVVTLLVIILIVPFIFKLEPEVAYSDKKEIVEKLEKELNLPTIYCFNSSNNRFLDDILLFAKIDESYIAKDMEYTEENINSVLQGKDLSRGLVVFINEGQEHDEVLDAIKNATNLNNSEHLKRLNACDVYYINKK